MKRSNRDTGHVMTEIPPGLEKIGNLYCACKARDSCEQVPQIPAVLIKMDELDHKLLAQISKDIHEIRNSSANSARAFWFGILHGAGSVVGAILIVALIGWVLNVTGIIPQLGSFTQALKNIISNSQK